MMADRHRWEILKTRFDWLGMRVRGAIVSTHKTHTAAEARLGDLKQRRGERLRIIRSTEVNAIPRMGEWWPA